MVGVTCFDIWHDGAMFMGEGSASLIQSLKFCTTANHETLEQSYITSLCTNVHNFY